MGFMFCDLHVSLKSPFVGGYKSSNLPCYLLKTRILFNSGKIKMKKLIYYHTTMKNLFVPV